MNVNVHIERLVLEGLDVSSRDGDAIGAAVQRELARLVPGAQLGVIPDAGHLPNEENPAAFNQAVGAFLEKAEVMYGSHGGW